MTTATAASPLWFIHNLARVRAGDGPLALVEIEGRAGDMPPLHVHRREDEAFYVLEGRVTVLLPGETIELGPGDAAVAPRDVPHAYRVGSETARWIRAAPPAGFRAIVAAVAD